MVKKWGKKTMKKGGSGILTYGVNDYKVDAQLDNLATTRQMYNDQSVMNARVLGGGRKSRRKSGKKGGKTGGKSGKTGSKGKKTRRCK